MISGQRREEKVFRSWAWWLTPVIPVFRRLRQESGQEFKTSLANTLNSRASWDIEREI